MVERKRFSAFTLVAMGLNSGGCAGWYDWCGPILNGGVGFPSGFKQIMYRSLRFFADSSA